MIQEERVGLSSGGQVVIILIHTNETTFLITTRHAKLDVFFGFDVLLKVNVNNTSVLRTLQTNKLIPNV